MINNLFLIGGYEQYVWTAFIFAFACCYSLYLKTSAELKKNEKLFLEEFKTETNEKFQLNKRKRTSRKISFGISGI